ncbi:MAG: nucleotidyltransferase family protein [Rhodothermales bacterium]|nr:nucleotidyltransferase family protein [Rhodothermales bacterium]
MQAVRTNPTAIILAAGASERMGVLDKLLLPLVGKPIVQYVVEIACEWADSVLVVTTPAPSNEGMLEVLEDMPVEIVENVRHASGIGASIAAGVSAARLDVPGFMIMMGDMPHVSIRTIQTMMQRFAEDPSRIYVPVHEGQMGHPVIFPKEFRYRLEQIEMSKGVQDLINEHALMVTQLPVNDPGVVSDIDCPADYRGAILGT